MKAPSQLGSDLLPVGLAAVQLHAVLSQAAVVQPPLDNLQCGHLLRYEQHRPALGQRLSDDVGDGLRLAGAGRPLQHEAHALLGERYGLLLAGVGVQHLVDVRGPLAPVQVLGSYGIGARQLDRAAGQGPDHRVLQRQVPGRGQFLVHDHLGEREQS